MTQYKIYRKDNYIVVTNNLTQETQYGFVKEVFVDKSNANKSSYRVLNVRDFDENNVLLIDQILKEDGSAYTSQEFETFYAQNTGNFNGGGSAPEIPDAPEDGNIYGRQDGDWVEVTVGSQNLQQTMENGSEAIVDTTIYIQNTGAGGATSSIYFVPGGTMPNTTGLSVYTDNGLELTGTGFNLVSSLGEGRISSNGNAQLVIDSESGKLFLKGGTQGIDLNGQGGAVNINSFFGVKINSKNAVTSINLIEADETGNIDLSPPIQIIESTTYTVTTLKRTAIFTVKTVSSHTSTLPNPVGNGGAIYFFTNKTANTINLTTTSNGFWEGGTPQTTVTIPTGTTMRIVCDNETYNIL